VISESNCHHILQQTDQKFDHQRDDTLFVDYNYRCSWISCIILYIVFPHEPKVWGHWSWVNPSELARVLRSCSYFCSFLFLLCPWCITLITVHMSCSCLDIVQSISWFLNSAWLTLQPVNVSFLACFSNSKRLRALSSKALECFQGVHHCGYHSEKSYGAASFLIVRPEGNIIIDR
jgi:hypothetical protein